MFISLANHPVNDLGAFTDIGNASFFSSHRASWGSYNADKADPFLRGMPLADHTRVGGGRVLCHPPPDNCRDPGWLFGRAGMDRLMFAGKRLRVWGWIHFSAERTCFGID